MLKARASGAMPVEMPAGHEEKRIPLREVERGWAPRRVAVTSVFGDPLNPRTWSGAPANIAKGLSSAGFDVFGIWPRPSKAEKAWAAARHLLAGGRLSSGESLRRGAIMRHACARRTEEEALRRDARAILHTGTFALPAEQPSERLAHYLFCDHTWDLARRHHPEAAGYSAATMAKFEQLERESYGQVRHIFTFGRYVRDNLVSHYGVAPNRVSVVGSGMGNVRPYDGPKEYERATLLFVAKHLFVQKGGVLVLEAFKKIRRPGLKLVVVGSPDHASIAGWHPNVEFRSYLPWSALEQLYRDATMLVQPMLNDPWGQVYLEALLSRTPVVGLDRNGLPEIIEGGRHGFLVRDATPDALAAAIQDALSDPQRLARMGWSGQRHVLDTYSWERTSRRIGEVMAAA